MEARTKKVLEPVAFLFQLVTGILLFVFVMFHLYVTHLAEHDALSYDNVVERLSNPGFKAMYFLFLLAVSFHAFNGLRAIILDTDFGARNKRVVDVFCFLLFLIATAYGSVLLISF